MKRIEKWALNIITPIIMIGTVVLSFVAYAWVDNIVFNYSLQADWIWQGWPLTAVPAVVTALAVTFAGWVVLPMLLDEVWYRLRMRS